MLSDVTCEFLWCSVTVQKIQTRAKSHTTVWLLTPVVAIPIIQEKNTLYGFVTFKNGTWNTLNSLQTGKIGMHMCRKLLIETTDFLLHLF